LGFEGCGAGVKGGTKRKSDRSGSKEGRRKRRSRSVKGQIDDGLWVLADEALLIDVSLKVFARDYRDSLGLHAEARRKERR